MNSTKWLNPTAPKENIQIIAFSSHRGVEGFFRAEMNTCLEFSKQQPLFATVVPRTADALRKYGFEPDIVATPATGESLANAIYERDHSRNKTLVVHGDLTKGNLYKSLTEQGQPVTTMAVYSNQALHYSDQAPFPVAAVFVAAPSAAHRLLNNFPWLQQVTFVPIGPTTAGALKKMNIPNIHNIPASLDEQVTMLTHLWRMANKQKNKEFHR